MDTEGAVKKYWPWVLGGVAGLYLLSRMSGGGNSNNASGYYQVLASQNAAAAQNAQVQAQYQAQSNAQAIQMASIQAQRDVGMAQRDVALAQTAAAVQKSDNETAVNFILANAQLAGNVGAAATGIISALNEPANTAIVTMGRENAAALQAGAAVSMTSFLAQASMVNQSSKSAAQIISPMVTSPVVASGPVNTFNASAAASASSAASASGQSTQAIASSNASQSNSMWGGLGSMFTGVLGVL